MKKCLYNTWEEYIHARYKDKIENECKNFVFLKDGSEIVKARAKDRLSFVTVRQMGYRWPVEFYSPQYTDKSQKTRPDHRTTLYWNPKVTTDANGKASVKFYASDISKRYLVTLEGVSNDGTIVRKQTVIE